MSMYTSVAFATALSRNDVNMIGDHSGPGLTWSNLERNRPVKQKLKTVVSIAAAAAAAVIEIVV